MKRVVAVVLLCGACGDNELPPQRQVTSGTRLRARYEVAGGARRLVGWHDNELGLDCSFGPYFYQRHHRCVPDDNASVTSYYADASCTELAALADDPAATHVVQLGKNTCADEPRVFELGEVVPHSFATGSDGSCRPFDAFPLRRIGAEIPITSFASAGESPEVLGPLWLVTADGAVAPWGGWDGLRPVAPTRTGGGVLRWAPWIVAYAGLTQQFADPSCTVETAGYDLDAAECPVDAVLRFAGGTCTVAAFAELGPHADAAFQLDATTHTCVPAMDPGFGVDSYAVGRDIADDEFPEVSFELEGSGAVQVRHAVLGGRAVLQTGTDIQFGGHGPPQPDTFVDAASGLPCASLPAADGVLRCLPAPPGTSRLFLDAACTEQLMAVATGSGACFPSADPSPTLLTSVDAMGRVHAFPRGPAIAPTQIFIADVTTTPCAPTTVEPNTSYFRVGAELPAASFAAVTVERE